MLQVKLSDDPTKGGFNPEFLIMKWRKIQELKNISLTGLMTINPKGLSSKENSDCSKNVVLSLILYNYQIVPWGCQVIGRKLLTLDQLG